MKRIKEKLLKRRQDNEYLDLSEDGKFPKWETVTEFICQARVVHGNQYDYSLVRGKTKKEVNAIMEKYFGKKDYLK
jgi:hypothetical protein